MKNFPLRLPDDLRLRADDEARRQRRSLNALLVVALESYLDQLAAGGHGAGIMPAGPPPTAPYAKDDDGVIDFD